MLPDKWPIREVFVPRNSRVGDVAAMLRMMQPLNGPAADLVAGKRQLLADLCRFIGVQVGGVSPESLGIPPETAPQTSALDPAIKTELSPRMEQTLQHLLNGDSEKQVARKLLLSQHTVHVYVKAIYRRYGVSSRGELLAKHFRR